MRKQSTKKRVAGKGAGDGKDVDQRKVEPEELAPIDLYHFLVKESLAIANERIAKVKSDSDGEPLTAEDMRDPADSLLLCLFNRFNNHFPIQAHDRLGYDRDRGEIGHRLRRLSSAASVTTRNHSNHRLDEILEALFYEARLLVESQSVFCEHCEHCLREHPEQRRYEMKTDFTLDDKSLAATIEYMVDGVADAHSELILLLKHIDSLVWVSRPGAVREVIDRVIDKLVDDQINEHEVRDRLIATAQQNLQERMRIDAGHGEKGGDV